MWSHEESITTTSSPERVWALLSDVEGWKKWNAGIEHIELHGPFAKGTQFSMQPPGEDVFLSTLVEVTPNRGFTDETVIDGTRVLVFHEIAALQAGGTKITYRTEITGPEEAQFGPFVTGDFPDVLAALKRTAEAG
jgi:uncharacterized protein YndB with AHSA1/START domain